MNKSLDYDLYLDKLIAISNEILELDLEDEGNLAKLEEYQNTQSSIRGYLDQLSDSGLNGAQKNRMKECHEIESRIYSKLQKLKDEYERKMKKIEQGNKVKQAYDFDAVEGSGYFLDQYK